MNGLQFLAPLNFLWGFLAIPLILLYMLRLRRREQTVSSNLLWQRFVRDREANTLWQRLRANWLLVLQLLILTALVLALVRPYFPTATIAGGNIIFLLDASGSMQAQDVQPNRFAQAKEEIKRMVDGSAPGDQLTLIKVGTAPNILVPATTDRAQLGQVLDAAQAEFGEVDWESAVILANGLAASLQDPQIVILSDGGLPDDLPEIMAEVHFLPLGASSENLAVTALSVRESSQGPTVFSSVQNLGSEKQEALLRLIVDSQLFDARKISLERGTQFSESWLLPDQAVNVEASLTNISNDHLAIDNQAFAVRAQKFEKRALLLSSGNLFLEQVYRALPGIEAFKTAPDGDFNADDYDFLIYDNSLPGLPLPNVDMLLVNPPIQTDSPIMLATGIFTRTQKIGQEGSPLLQFIDWRNVHIQQAKRIEAPWAVSIIEGADGPLLLAGEYDGRRIVVIPFDLRESDLPLQIAFPILMANITDWLSPSGAIETINNMQPSQAIAINPPIGSKSVFVESPNGKLWESEVNGGPVVYLNASAPGLYKVSFQETNDQQTNEYMAVNTFSNNESQITPKTSVRLGFAEIGSAQEKTVGQNEIWYWSLFLALIILIPEWWLHFKGWRLPGMRLS